MTENCSLVFRYLIGNLIPKKSCLESKGGFGFYVLRSHA